jgi:methylenetetrahydrofolate--tRNA-(uracil-5-)-methyltransferase
MKEKRTVTVVGGGLAGSEAAWQLADRGVPVRLYEMRPQTQTGAHQTAMLGEIVCSNSFKSTRADTASGILKAELDILGCRLLGVAREVAVPAGHALAVDRQLFAEAVTKAVDSHPGITVVRERVDGLDLPEPAVIATGPLTSSELSDALRRHLDNEHLYFYDAIAPSIDRDSVDPDAGFWASRYGKGDADYLNIPLDEAAYGRLLDAIRRADYATTHAFEEEKYFEACMPIEAIAARGDDTLRHGPMKPRGLIDPRTGREPFAAIQLRQENKDGSLLGMVGFQTRMTWPCQKAMIRSIPGLERVEILRYGTIHRNVFLDIPRVCKPYLSDRRRPELYYAGQICGVEGYVESIGSAVVVALSIYAGLNGRFLPELPRQTMLGALMTYVHTPNDDFQPMNANMGIVPVPITARGRHAGGRRVRRKERNEAVSRASAGAVRAWREARPWLF